MQLPTLDFSPLRGALSLGQTAAQAALLPEGQEIQSQLRALQKSDIDLRREASLAGERIDSRNQFFDTMNQAVDVATRIYSIVEQGQTEKAKGQVLEMSKALELQAQKDIFNGKFTSKTAADGTQSFQMSEEYETLRGTYEAQLAETYGGMPNVANFAKANLSAKNGEVQTWALGQKYAAATQERDALASQNLSDAIQTARKTGNMAVVAEAVASRTWNTPEQRDAILKVAETDVRDFRVSDQALAIGVSQGYAAGLEHLEKNAGGMDDKKKEQARVDLGRQEERLQTATNQTFSEAMLNGLKDGKTPASVMAELKKSNVPEGRKAQAIEAAQTAQAAAATDRGIEVYNKARDKDLAGLKSDRERIQSGNLAYLYEGVPETKKAILDLFDREIAALTPDEPSKTDGQEQYDRLMEATLQQYKDGAIDFAGAMSNAKQYAEFCSPSKIGTTMNALRDMVPAQYQPVYDKLKGVTETTFRSLVKNKDKDLTAEQTIVLGEIQSFVMGQCLDLVQDSTKDTMNPKIFAERTTSVVQSLLSKEYDYTVKGGFFGIGKVTPEEAAAKVQYSLQNNPALTDSLVYQDANKMDRWAPTALANMAPVWDVQEGLVKKYAGKDVSRAQEVMGKDVGATAIWRTPSGDLYRVVSPDGKKNVVQVKKEGGGWMEAQSTTSSYGRSK